MSVTKFQNFWITVILLVAYMVTAFEHVGKAPTVAELTSLPDLHQSLNFLLGISHAGYIGGKLPDRK